MITEISNIRSANGSPVTGFELTVNHLSELGEMIYLADALHEKVRSALYTDCRISVEAVVAEYGEKMRYGINFRFRFSDPYTTDNDLSSFREKARSLAVALLAERGINACSAPAGGGTVVALPARDFVFLRKQQITGCLSSNHGFSSVPAFFFAPLDKAVINWKEVEMALRVNKNSGLSVHLIPAEPSAAAQKLYIAAAGEAGASADYRRSYQALLDSPISYHYIITVWGKAYKEIMALLELGGASFRKISMEDADPDLLYYELALDPWQLSERLCQYRCSHSVGEAAYTVTQSELAAFLPAHENSAPVRNLPDPAPTVERAKTEVQPDADELSSLERDILSLDESLTGLSDKIDELKKKTPLYELLDRMGSIEDKLDEVMISRQNTPASASVIASLKQIKSEIISQVSDSAAMVQSRIDEQSGKLSGDLAKTEASINQNIDSRSAELSRKFDDLLTSITSSATPQEAIAEAKAAGVSFELTDADVQMLGFSNKEELSANLGDPNIYEALAYTVGFYRLADKAKEEGKTNYFPFVIMIGYLYEMIATKFMDNYYRQYKACFSPDTPLIEDRDTKVKDDDLLRFDCNNSIYRTKIQYGYEKTPRFRTYIYSRAVVFSDEIAVHNCFKKFNGKRKLIADDWAVWFALFSQIRNYRNYVHSADHASLPESEASVLFNAFFGADASQRTKLLSMGEKTSNDYLIKNAKNGKIFGVSIFRFILLFQYSAWDTEEADLAIKKL